MGFARIDLRGIDAFLRLEIATKFQNRLDKLEPLRRSNSADYMLYISGVKSALISAIEALGGDGVEALRLVDDWVDHPYRTPLRWAVSVASSQDVSEELERVQARAYAIFISTQRKLIEDDKAYRPAVLEEIYDKILNIISNKDNASRHRHDVKNFVARLPPLEPIAKYALNHDVEMIFQRQSILFSELQEMSEAATRGSQPHIVKTVQAMSALSKSMSEKNITLYRGICCEHGHDIYQRVQETEGSFEVGTDHATSFTNVRRTAVTFANGLGMSTRKTKNNESIIISISTPSYAIVAYPGVFTRLSGEDEYIVATDGTLTMDKSNVTALRDSSR